MARPRIDPSTVGVGVRRSKQTKGINTAIEQDFGAFFPIMEQHPKLVQAIMPGVLNRTGATAWTAGSKALRGVYNIKGRRLKEARMEIKARRNSFMYEVRIKSRGAGLINFGARQVKKGVSYAILKGKRNTIAHSFIAPMLGIKQGEDSRKGVFIRKGKKVTPTKGAYKGRTITRGAKAGELLTRQKLQRFIGPGPAAMWGKRFVQDAFIARATEFLPIEYNRRMTVKLNALVTKHRSRK